MDNEKAKSENETKTDYGFVDSMFLPRHLKSFPTEKPTNASKEEEDNNKPSNSKKI